MEGTLYILSDGIRRGDHMLHVGPYSVGSGRLLVSYKKTQRDLDHFELQYVLAQQRII